MLADQRLKHHSEKRFPNERLPKLGCSSKWPSFKHSGSLVQSLDDARRKCEAWRRDYNEERPHSAIDNTAADRTVIAARTDRNWLEKGQRAVQGWRADH